MTLPTKWNYHFIIDILTYLVNTTWPDITFTVHHCTTWCKNLLNRAETLVKRICRHLKRTYDKSYIINSARKTTKNDCFVDADFTGTWHLLDKADPQSIHSRIKYVICYAGCPILWKIKPQTEIYISTKCAQELVKTDKYRPRNNHICQTITTNSMQWKHWWEFSKHTLISSWQPSFFATWYSLDQQRRPISW